MPITTDFLLHNVQTTGSGRFNFDYQNYIIILGLKTSAISQESVIERSHTRTLGPKWIYQLVRTTILLEGGVLGTWLASGTRSAIKYQPVMASSYLAFHLLHATELVICQPIYGAKLELAFYLRGT